MNQPYQDSQTDTDLANSDPDRVVHSDEARKLIADLKKSSVSFKTGIPELDLLTDGLEGGEMVVVGGKTKNGKTLLLQTMMRNFHAQGVKSLFFSYEVPMRQFLGQVSADVKFYLPLELKSQGTAWIEKKVDEAKENFDCVAVFIDHLHYLIDMDRLRNPSLEIGAIVRRLKRIAVDFNVVIFLVSHVSKIQHGVSEITEDNLRDSGMTACEADSIWIVSRVFDTVEKTATNKAYVDVRNHRRTGVMARKVMLEKRGFYFEPIGADELQLTPRGDGGYEY